MVAKKTIAQPVQVQALKEFAEASLPETWMDQRNVMCCYFKREDVVVSVEAHARQGRWTLQPVQIGLTCDQKQYFLSGDSTEFIRSEFRFDVFALMIFSAGRPWRRWRC